MQLMDGQAVSQHIKKELAAEVENWRQQGKKIPHLAVIMVGENPASASYVSAKVKSCEQVGFKSTLRHFPDHLTEKELLAAITELNRDDDVDGILVQLPLPAHISEMQVINTIAPEKDVDGFHPITQGKMILGQPSFLPATPYGILLLLSHYNINTAGKHCVVIGRSNIVGKPMSILLSRNDKQGNATVTMCHSRTSNLKMHTLQADIIVAAIGQPHFVTADMVKEGAVVIDVGINRIADNSKKTGNRLVGDVDFESVRAKASYLTPVPKGVGPMTICGLLKNTMQAALQRQQ